MHPNQITTIKEGKDAVAQLLGQINEYEELLEKALSKPKHMGVIASDPVDGMYRVVNSESGSSSYLPVHPKSDVEYFDTKDVVLYTENFILRMMPEEFIPKPKPIDFKRITWKEIGGMKSQLESIKEMIEQPLTHQHLYSEFNLEPLNGLLLYGPPGCGKTLIAKAVATRVLDSLDEPNADSYIYVKGAELLSMYVGQAENNIKNLFDRCRKHQRETGVRSILAFDEADALFPIRGSRRSSDVDTTIIPTYLAEVNGFDTENPFIILLTNKPDSIDPAVIRDGRIDSKIGIFRPTLEDAIDIFKIHLGKTKLNGDIDLIASSAANELFNTTMKTNVSGAMIETIVKKSGQKAINRKIKNKSSIAAITIEDITNIINQHEHETNF